MSRILLSKNNQITQNYKAGIHNGIDIVGQGSTLDTIVAHSSGKVVLVQTGHKNNVNATGDATYGNLVKIKHSNSYTTLYAHLNDVYVKVGQVVTQGQKIGYMGNTGRSYGAHLHFEVRISDSYNTIINPTPYINADLPGLTNSKAEYVKQWQRAMNNSYGLNLAVDGSYGPLSQKVSAEYRLYWKNPQINNEYVRWVQSRLNQLGFGGKDNFVLKTDGYFGENTDWAVRQYQKARLIAIDGIVGRYTVEWLLKDE